MCSVGQTFGVSRHRLDDVVGELGGVRRGEPDPLQPVDAPARAQQLGESAAVAGLLGVGERDAVGVDVLAEQRHLEHALVDQRLHLGQDVAGPAVDLLAAQRRARCRTCRCCCSRRRWKPKQRRRIRARPAAPTGILERLDDLDLRRAVVPGAVEQRRQRADVVGAEHDVHPRRLAQHGVAVLLGQAAADGDLHVGVACLRGARWLRLPYSLSAPPMSTTCAARTSTTTPRCSACRRSRRWKRRR